MDDVYYSTGQAARELGITQAKVRILCETEAIDSTRTAGGQRRIAREEVERLKRDGLPSIPRPLPEPDRVAARPAVRSRYGGVELLAEPSETVIESAEEVVCLENEVKAIGLRRQKEEGLDWFRERDDRDAARQAEREDGERERQAQADAQRQRELWEEKWIDYALRSVSDDAPQPYQLEVHRIVEETLQRIKVNQAESTTRQLVDAAVNRALAPWYKAKQVTDAIKEACEAYSLPWEMKHDQTWKASMYEAAAAGIARLRDGVGRAEIETAARQAIMPLVCEFEHRRACAQMVNGVWSELSGGNADEWEQGKEAVQVALAELPVGASRRELDRARATALEPIRIAIAARLDQEMRVGLLQHIEFRFIGWPDHLQKQALAAIHEALNRLHTGTSRFELERARDQAIERFRGLYQRHEQKTRLIDSALRHIRPYLDKLTTDWEFDKSTFALASELESPVRSALEEELRGNETSEEVERRVRQLVRRELDL